MIERLSGNIAWQKSRFLRPTVCLGATYVVAYTYEYDGGRIEPTHCALIDAGLGDRSRQRRACSRPLAGAGSARIGLVVGSRPGSTADPGGFRQSRTTPPSGTRSYWIPGSWHVRTVYTDAISCHDPSQ